MAPPQVLSWRDIRRENIVYESSKQNKHNGMTVPVKYKDNDGRLHPMVFQTPTMTLPFGISDKVLEKYGRKVEASLSFPNYCPSVPDDGGDVQPGWSEPEMQEFFEWVSMWDAMNPDTVCKNSQTYFRKQISDVVVQELYKPNIKPSSQPDKYSPTLRCKIPTSNDEPTTDFFAVDSTGTVPSEMSRVKNGSRVICILKTTGLWFAGKSFGMNFHVVQMVQLASDKFEGCAIKIPSELMPAPFDPGTPPEEDDSSVHTVKKQRV